MSDKLETFKGKNTEIKFNVPSIGTGRLVPVATHIVIMLAMLESDHWSRLMVLHSVIEEFGFEPEDFAKYERNGERHMNGDWNNDEPYSFTREK